MIDFLIGWFWASLVTTALWALALGPRRTAEKRAADDFEAWMRGAAPMSPRTTIPTGPLPALLALVVAGWRDLSLRWRCPSV